LNYGAVGFITRRCQVALPGTAAIELWLNVIFAEFHSRRYAVNDYTYAATVRFTEGRYFEKCSECAGHSFLIFFR